MVLYKQAAIDCLCPFSFAVKSNLYSKWLKGRKRALVKGVRSWRWQIPKQGCYALDSGQETRAMSSAVGVQELKGTYWIWEARSLYTHLLLCLLVISPGSRVQSQKSENKVSLPSWRSHCCLALSYVRGRSWELSALGSLYPSLLPLLCFHAVQPFHQAGDPLLQAVNRVVLWIMATETVPEAAKGITNQLQVICLPKKQEVSQT